MGVSLLYQVEQLTPSEDDPFASFMDDEKKTPIEGSRDPFDKASDLSFTVSCLCL